MYELKSFIGRVVVSPTTRRRYILTKISTPLFEATPLPCLEGQEGMTCVFQCANGDPITTGVLTFEEEGMTETFKQAYAAYWRSQEAFWEKH